MQKIREWAFPVGLFLAWMLATVYTVRALSELHAATAREAAYVSASAQPTA
jgi:hypothetical protein